MIAIVDYGMGNLRSVQKALQKLGAQALLTSDPGVVRRAHAVVLPGVGAFCAAMENLRRASLDQVVREAILKGKPFLGICLGFQLLLESSEEGGREPGLGLLRGRVVGFKSQPQFNLPVPHIGWNALHLTRSSPLWQGVQEGDYVYFVHSYYPEPDDPTLMIATVEYGIEFPCAIMHENIYATQFHPEKSGLVGQRLLKNFLSIAAIK